MKPLRPTAPVVFVAALALIAAACGGTDDVVNRGTGNVRLSMVSAPATAATTLDGGDHDDGDREDSIASASVTLASILARNLDGQLISVSSALPVTVDLMTVVSGGRVDLPAGTLPPGTYDQLVVVMTKVELTLTDGTMVAITPPGGGWTAIIPTEPFTVVEGATTALELQLRDGAFRFLDGEFEFDPEFDCRRR